MRGPTTSTVLLELPQALPNRVLRGEAAGAHDQAVQEGPQYPRSEGRAPAWSLLRIGNRGALHSDRVERSRATEAGPHRCLPEAPGGRPGARPPFGRSPQPRPAAAGLPAPAA